MARRCPPGEIVFISTSRIVICHPVWRYFWPFQSTIRLVSYAMLLPAGLLAISALLYFLAPAAPLLPVLLAVAIGAIPASYAMLPAEMTIRTSGGTTGVARSIREHILASSYMITAMGNGAIRYTPVGPRWLRWRRNAVTVSPCADSMLLLQGSVVGLSRIRKLLEGSRAGPSGAISTAS